MSGDHHIRKVFVLISLLLCICGLSGCSEVTQSLADGTDALLNGLADITDSAMNGLADAADGVLNGVSDATEQALNSLSEAEDGQLKDGILNIYGALIDKAGAAALTPEGELEGRLERGADDYTGAYAATYADFTGTELLFGGTTLEREGGSTLKIECSLSLEGGEAAVFLRSGAEDPVVLLSGSGAYTGTVEVDGASTYIGVWGDHASGTVSIAIE